MLVTQIDLRGAMAVPQKGQGQRRQRRRPKGCWALSALWCNKNCAQPSRTRARGLASTILAQLLQLHPQSPQSTVVRIEAQRRR